MIRDFHHVPQLGIGLSLSSLATSDTQHALAHDPSLSPLEQSLELSAINAVASSHGPTSEEDDVLLANASLLNSTRPRTGSGSGGTGTGPVHHIMIPVDSEARERHIARAAMASDLPECSLCCAMEALEKLTLKERIMVVAGLFILVTIIVVVILATKK